MKNKEIFSAAAYRLSNRAQNGRVVCSKYMGFFAVSPLGQTEGSGIHLPLFYIFIFFVLAFVLLPISKTFHLYTGLSSAALRGAFLRRLTTLLRVIYLPFPRMRILSRDLKNFPPCLSFSFHIRNNKRKEVGHSWGMQSPQECRTRTQKATKKLTMSSVLFLEIEGHTMMSHYIDINKKERRP